VVAIKIAGCGAKRVKAYIRVQCLGCIRIHDLDDGSNGLCSLKAKQIKNRSKNWNYMAPWHAQTAFLYHLGPLL
jgi:hypothetical protein